STQQTYKGAQIVNIDCPKSPLFETPVYALRALKHASQQNFDIIHMHALSCGAFSKICKWIAPKTKIIVTIHGLDWQRAKWGIAARSLLKMGETASRRYSDLLFCVSFSLHTYFCMRYPGVRSVYIPNGINPQKKCPIFPPEGLESRKYVLYLGRLVPEKGVHHLIEAYKKITTDFPLIIAGPTLNDDGYNKMLHQLAEGDSRIRFVGIVEGEEKLCYLTHAHLFVLPSEIEGLPIALLEAAAHGVCPLISNIPTAIEVLGTENVTRGFTFDLLEKNQLQEVLELSFNCPELVAQLGEKASAYVRDHFNWNTIAERTHHHYRR
ncbi:MAG: glycosyltransferase family 4 protein, partial [Chlamydiia bacterium]|nr:glycosyltransferase family 4 protein [Chlamydiia bacterium]